jgi:transposase-like protein
LGYANASNLNNVIEQDHRTVKKRTWLAKGYGSFQGVANVAGHRSNPYDSERKSKMAGQSRCRRQALFITELFGIAA